jgi:hypothetical protein
MTEAAMMMPQGVSNCEAPLRSAIATGTVRVVFDEVKVSANRNSFQAPMKARSPVVTIAGHISGRNTLVMITQGVAPSTIAASSISIGRSRMKVVSTQTVKGSVKIV